jgi:hypothetical protein
MTRVVEFQGITASVVEHCKRLGLQPRRIYHRLSIGWPVERALSEPIVPRAREVERLRIERDGAFESRDRMRDALNLALDEDKRLRAAQGELVAAIREAVTLLYTVGQKLTHAKADALRALADKHGGAA